jgi:hypothetical protein
MKSKQELIDGSEIKWVEVRDDCGSWKKTILLVDLGEKVIEGRYICVCREDIDRYIDGKTYEVIMWDQMREFNGLETLTHKEIEELIGRPFEYFGD